MTLIAKLTAIATAISQITTLIPQAEALLTDFSTFLDTV